MQTAREASAAQRQLLSAQSLIEDRRLDTTPAELDLSAAAFSAATRDFHSARVRIEHDPALWLLRRLPLVGGQVDASVTLAEIGEQAGQIGVDGANAVRDFDAVRAEGEGTLPEKSLTIFDRTAPDLDAVEARLADVDARRARLGGRSLLPPLRSAVRELDDRRASLHDLVALYRRSRAFTPEFLGFSRPKTYLILAQNNAELLPTGGLVSVVGTMRFDRGRMSDLNFEDAIPIGRRWMDQGNYIVPPEPLRQYLLKDTSWNLLVSNWSPDFPTSARTAQLFYGLGTGTQVDGVIGINVNTLARLLEVTGPVDVPSFGVTVTSANVLEVTEEHTRAAYEPGGDRKEFVGVLAREVLDRVLRPGRGMWSPLIDAVQQLGETKDLLIYSPDESQQALIREFGWDGEVRRPDAGDFLMLVEASVNSTKLNAVLEQSLDVTVQLDSAGRATTVLQMDYFNNLAPWTVGKDPSLVEGLMIAGQYGDYLRLFVTPDSRILQVQDDRGEIGVEEAQPELGLMAFGRYFAVPRDTRKRITVRYITPPIVQMDGDTWSYRLKLQKQPGQQPMPVKLRVLAPTGMQIASATVTGAHESQGVGELSFHLDADRVVDVALRRR